MITPKSSYLGQPQILIAISLLFIVSASVLYANEETIRNQDKIDKIVRYFDLIVLGSDSKNGTNLVNKWDTPINIRVVGRFIPEFESYVRNHTEMLRSLTHHQINFTNEKDSNFIILFGTTDDIKYALTIKEIRDLFEQKKCVRAVWLSSEMKVP